MDHERQVKDELRFYKLTEALERNAVDGLSSISFKMLRSRSERHYTNYTVVIDNTDADKFAEGNHQLSDKGMEKEERRNGG